MASIGVFLLDDHEDVRRILRRLIDTSGDLSVVGESGSVAGAVDQVLSTRPHVAVLDVRLGDGSGIEVGRDLRSAAPDVRCVMLTGSMDDEALMATVAAGAAGYILKPAKADVLQRTIRQAASGEAFVSAAVASRVMDRLRKRSRERAGALGPEEQRVLDLVAEGRTNQEIGRELTLPEHEVKGHIARVLAVLEIH